MRMSLQDVVKNIRQKVAETIEDDGPLHQKMVRIEEELEEKVGRMDQHLDGVACDIEQRLEVVALAIVQAGQEFDDHVEEIERKLDQKTTEFVQAIEETLEE